MELSHIDHGEPFDWSRTSQDYARYRDIYPPEFFRPLTGRKTEKNTRGARFFHNTPPSDVWRVGGCLDLVE